MAPCAGVGAHNCRIERRARGHGRAFDQLISEARIRATTDVIVLPEDQAISDVMQIASKDADVVFLGLMIPEAGQERAYAERLLQLAGGFPTTIFVRNAGKFAGELL